MKIQMANPKLIISQYYDSLKRNIDIQTEERLEAICNTENKASENDSEENPNVYDDFLEDDEDEEDVNRADEENFFEHRIEHQMFPRFQNTTNVFELEETPLIENQNFLHQELVEQSRVEMLAELDECVNEAMNRYEVIRKSRDINISSSNDAQIFAEEIFTSKFCFILTPNGLDEESTIQLIVLDFHLNSNQRQIIWYCDNNLKLIFVILTKTFYFPFYF